VHWLRCIHVMGRTAQEGSGTTEDEVCGADVAVVPEGCCTAYRFFYDPSVDGL